MTEMFVKLIGAIAHFLHNHYLSHPLLAVVSQTFIAVPLRIFRVRAAWWIGAFFAIGMYYGRERRDCEVARKFHPVDEWYRCWSPWPDWSRDNHLDFWPVLAATLLIALLVSYSRRPRRSKIGL